MQYERNTLHNRLRIAITNIYSIYSMKSSNSFQIQHTPEILGEAFIYFTFFCLSSCHESVEQKRLAAISVLPAFVVISVDNTRINSADLPMGRPYIFMYFDPDCEHCQHTTRQLVAHRRDFNGARIFMVNGFPGRDIASFIKKFNLNSLSNVFVGADSSYSFYRAFAPRAIPYFAVYDAKKKLRMISTGEINMNDLFKIVHE